MKNRKQKKYSRSSKARDLLRRHLFSLLSRRQQTGFSIFELVTVVAVLGILSAIAVSSIGNATKFAQLDEAKALLNSAAIECLQTFRIGGDMDTSEPEVLKNRKGALPGNYEYGCREGDTNLKCVSGTHNKCGFTSIYDPTSKVSLLVDLKFWVDEGGKINKEAGWTDPDTKNACNSWGGCGGNECGRIVSECRDRTKICNDKYALAKDTNGLSRNVLWEGQCACPETSPKPDCLGDCYFYKGTCHRDEKDYIAAEEKDGTAKCNTHKSELRDSSFDGLDPEGIAHQCKKNEWWCSGKNKDSEEDYDLCKIEERKEKCTLAVDEWLKDTVSVTGTFQDTANICDEYYYKCDSKKVDSNKFKECGDPCTLAVDEWLKDTVKVDGEFTDPTNVCSKKFYKCKGDILTYDAYKDSCGATQECCTNFKESWCKYSENWESYPVECCGENGCCGPSRTCS